MNKKHTLWLTIAVLIFITLFAALFATGALHGAINFILHIDRHLTELSAQYGVWIYAILFVIVFCETGLVITPFLPGDSLLFAAGSIAALGSMNIHTMALLLMLAAILGDAVNFAIGKYLGERLFANPDSRIFRRSYLQRTEAFYAKHGGKTIILARFVPIVRTFAPFVAGMGHMSYGRFFRFNVIGGIAWVALFSCAGFWFGQQPIVKENLTLILLAIIIISVLPAIIEIIRARRV
ncbi:MAG: DedA family protein [Cardiobacterium sp.]|nr:MAG: DedA family protein [Cardiobacterium sp.]